MMVPTSRRPRSVLRYLVAGIGILLAVVLLVPVAFWLAAHLRERQTRSESAPATGRFIQAADVEIHLQERGPADGPPVVLIHGTGAWSAIWGETMDALAQAGYRAIALDLPPFGFSERPVPPSYGDAAQASRIVGVLDALELQAVTLVGHSFGSRPTVEAALRDPGRIRALVLVDAALDLQRPPDASSRPPWLVRLLLATPLTRDPLVASSITNPLLSRRLLRTLIFDPQDATDAQVQMAQDQFPVAGTTHALGEWLREFVGTVDHSAATERASYARLTMPTLLLWGREDTITPLAQGEDLLTLLSRGELVVLEHTGHIPAIEDATAFNAALVGFLERQGVLSR